MPTMVEYMDKAYNARPDEVANLLSLNHLAPLSRLLKMLPSFAARYATRLFVIDRVWYLKVLTEGTE